MEATAQLKNPVVLFNKVAKLKEDRHIYSKGDSCAVYDDGGDILLVSMNIDGQRGYISRNKLIFK